MRATIIAGVALPLSLIATFGVMWFAGFSLDNLSLMALTIGTGFVVDDAIVMIENIVRHMENGEKPLDAALRGASEIGFTVISLTLSLIAVFIPLLFMTGLVGRMFREFALTLTIAVVASAVVSLTLTPMMCSPAAAPQRRRRRQRALAARFRRCIDRTVEFYHRSLIWVLRHQRATLLVTLATLAATIFLYIVMPKGFLPLQDTGLITAVTEAGTDVSFAEMQRRQNQVEAIVRADPDVTGVVSVIGVCPLNATPNAGRLAITLKPRDQRSAHVAAIIARLKDAVAGIPGMTVYFQAMQDIQISTRVEPRAVPVHAGRHRSRRGAGHGPNKLTRELRGDPALRDVASEAQEGGPRVNVDVDREQAGRLGVSHAEHHRHAQRRLRPAADFDHLRPGQPVPRHPGGAAALPAGPRLARQALRHRRQHLDRHGGHRRQYRARQHQYQHHRDAQRGNQLEPGAARRFRAFRATPRRRWRSRTRSSSRLGHHQLRSRRRLRAVRRGRRHQRGAAARSACRRR